MVVYLSIVKNKTSIMKNLEMNLTAREIKFIALESQGVDVYSTNLLSQFSYRTQGFIFKASRQSKLYVVKRCHYLYFGKTIKA